MAGVAAPRDSGTPIIDASQTAAPAAKLCRRTPGARSPPPSATPFSAARPDSRRGARPDRPSRHPPAPSSRWPALATLPGSSRCSGGRPEFEARPHPPTRASSTAASCRCLGAGAPAAAQPHFGPGDDDRGGSAAGATSGAAESPPTPPGQTSQAGTLIAGRRSPDERADLFHEQTHGRVGMTVVPARRLPELGSARRRARGPGVPSRRAAGPDGRGRGSGAALGQVRNARRPRSVAGAEAGDRQRAESADEGFAGSNAPRRIASNSSSSASGSSAATAASARQACSRVWISSQSSARTRSGTSGVTSAASVSASSASASAAAPRTRASAPVSQAAMRGTDSGACRR